MSIKVLFIVGSVAIIAFVAQIEAGWAAETGTKTLPDSSIYPPPTPAPVFNSNDHRWCYLPSSPCDNNHRDTN